MMRLRAGNPKKMQSEGVDESAPTRPGAPRGGIFLYEQVDVTSFSCFTAVLRPQPPRCVSCF